MGFAERLRVLNKGRATVPIRSEDHHGFCRAGKPLQVIGDHVLSWMRLHIQEDQDRTMSLGDRKVVLMRNIRARRPSNFEPQPGLHAGHLLQVGQTPIVKEIYLHLRCGVGETA